MKGKQLIKVTKEPLINASIAEIDISIERKNLQLLYLGRSCKQSAFLVHPVNIREDQEEILVNVGSDSPPPMLRSPAQRRAQQPPALPQHDPLAGCKGKEACGS